ncbi:hypothetical protein EVAR_92999_1 [Eumeta japonica]|uniref:Uncharacterized protein n=1 Tax=Eumeta variegata TaxID=151549 RepID=A0A4C1TDJ4_EUMVA|nr:hypothetical protein EVAR_92999_1 [Eumeta japonica]
MTAMSNAYDLTPSSEEASPTWRYRRHVTDLWVPNKQAPRHRRNDAKEVARTAKTYNGFGWLLAISDASFINLDKVGSSKFRLSLAFCSLGGMFLIELEHRKSAVSSAKAGIRCLSKVARNRLRTLSIAVKRA